MTSAAAVVGLTYRGTDVQIIDGLFLEIKRGLRGVVAVRGDDLIVPGAAGRLPRNREADRLPIELRGWVRGSGATVADQKADFEAQVAAMRLLFDPRLDPGELVATLQDGTELALDARSVNVLDIERLPMFLELSIELESIDPDWVEL